MKTVVRYYSLFVLFFVYSENVQAQTLGLGIKFIGLENVSGYGRTNYITMYDSFEKIFLRAGVCLIDFGSEKSNKFQGQSEIYRSSSGGIGAGLYLAFIPPALKLVVGDCKEVRFQPFIEGVYQVDKTIGFLEGFNRSKELPDEVNLRDIDQHHLNIGVECSAPLFNLIMWERPCRLYLDLSIGYAFTFFSDQASSSRTTQGVKYVGPNSSGLISIGVGTKILVY